MAETARYSHSTNNLPTEIMEEICVDDVMEVVRKGYEQELTEHLYSIDTTGSFKFIYEEESDNSLPFLDTLMIRKEDGTVKLLVYRKKTHTDQYLNFTSHHPLHQKLRVIKTLLDRCNIVSEPEDREKEVEHITKAQERCGYPSWIIKNVKEQQSQKGKTTEKKEKKKSKGMVTLPYVKGVTEPVQRILIHHEIATSVRPHQNIRRILVHP